MLILTSAVIMLVANTVLGAADRRNCLRLLDYNSLSKSVLLVHGELLAPDKLLPWPAIRRPSSVRPSSIVPCKLFTFSTSSPKLKVGLIPGRRHFGNMYI